MEEYASVLTIDYCLDRRMYLKCTFA